MGDLNGSRQADCDDMRNVKIGDHYDQVVRQ